MKIMLCAFLIVGAVGALEVGDKVTAVVAETINDIADKMTKRNLLERESDLLIVEIMSTDCRTCIASMPEMHRLSMSIGDEVVIKTVAIDRVLELDSFFFNNYSDLILYPFVFDFGRDVSKMFELRYTPSIFILNEKNQILYKHVGEVVGEDVDKMSAIVREQL